MRRAAFLPVLGLLLGACSARFRHAESVAHDRTIEESPCESRGPFGSLEGVSSLAEAERRLASQILFESLSALLVDPGWLDPPRTDIFGKPLLGVYNYAKAKRFSARPALAEKAIERVKYFLQHSDAIVGLGHVRGVEMGMEPANVGIAELYRVAMQAMFRGSASEGRELSLLRSGGAFELDGKLACSPYNEFHPLLRPGQRILLVATFERTCFPRLASFWQAVPIDALVDPDSATGADAQLARAALANPAFVRWFDARVGDLQP